MSIISHNHHPITYPRTQASLTLTLSPSRLLGTLYNYNNYLWRSLDNDAIVYRTLSINIIVDDQQVSIRLYGYSVNNHNKIIIHTLLYDMV